MPTEDTGDLILFFATRNPLVSVTMIWEGDRDPGTMREGDEDKN